MKKKLMALLGILALSAGLIAGCGSQPEENKAGNRIPVAASFFAMKEITEAIGGDKVYVETIIPDGAEPHDYELRPDDVKKIAAARLFVYNGLGMEPWAEKTVQSIHSDSLLSVALADHVTPIALTDEEEIQEHGAYDPHAWLGLSSAREEAAAVRDALIKVSPENKEYFEANYEKFASSLSSLESKYRADLSKAPRKHMVTGHAAFAYLCRDLGIEQASVEDVFASGEPSAKKLVELTEFCKANKVKTVFTEDQVSPAISETLAEEAGADTETIYTMESSVDGKGYLELMQDNLEKIKKALLDE
jgi:zinc transport system substrate-binding protein